MRWWIASAGFVGLYALLALVVRRAPDNSIDRRVLDWVLGWDAGFLDQAAERISWITDTEPRIVLAIVGLVGVAATGRLRFVAAVLFATALTAIPTDALDDVGGLVTGRERPNGAPFKAYPSGHTLGTVTQFGFSIYLAVRLGLPRWLLKVVVVVLGVPMVLVGPARLVKGVHWPTDVVGSYLLGAGSLIAAVLVFEIGERWLAGSPRFGSSRLAPGEKPGPAPPTASLTDGGAPPRGPVQPQRGAGPVALVTLMAGKRILEPCAIVRTRRRSQPRLRACLELWAEPQGRRSLRSRPVEPTC